jgi:beta-glucosidase
MARFATKNSPAVGFTQGECQCPRFRLHLGSAARPIAGALILLVVADMCVAVKAQTTPHATHPPSNAQLADPKIEARVEKLLNQMTLEEKIGQLVQYSDFGDPPLSNAQSESAHPQAKNKAPVLGANPEAAERINAQQLAATGRLGSVLNLTGAERTNAIQRLAVERSRLHIPLLFGADVIHGYRTIYPVPLGLAASFDPDLVAAVSRISAKEARTAGVNEFYSPMVDISRDPRWGRSVEGAGEDAYLGSAMARAYIHGYQGDDLSKPGSVAAYGAAEAGREYNTTDMSDIRLRQVYLPPYRAAVEAGAAAVMSAFNSLNGVPASANPYLLETILRGEWGFDGFVISDYTAVMELTNHGIALDAAMATRKAINAGVDIDMMSHFYDTQLPALIRSGAVTMQTVDDAVRRVLRVKFAMGLFEHPYAEGPEVTAAVSSHRPLVRKAAQESFVLLQNQKVGDAPLLPLSQDKKRIALIGPLVEDAGEMVGMPGVATEADTITGRKAFEEFAATNGSTILYARGTAIEDSSQAGFADAVKAANSADVVVLGLGESNAMSGEAGSRAYLDLPGNQQQLLEAVAATGKPIVLLVFSGRPLVLDWAAKHVPAIMEVWFPGTEAWHAIADVLYGKVAPSGKLPMSFPRAVGQEPLYYDQLPTGRPAPGNDPRFVSKYLDVANTALFPFGWGLSYSDFSYKDVRVSKSMLTLAEALTHRDSTLVEATATVTNSGSRTATEVVQCYVRNLGASIEQPVRNLKGFMRITLAPGESEEIRFPLGFRELSFIDRDSKNTIEATHYTVWIGGSSLADQYADFAVTAGRQSAEK